MVGFYDGAKPVPSISRRLMRLSTLIVFALAALTPAMVFADPIGYYNPATGGVSFSGLSDVVYLELGSSVPLIKENALGPVDATRFVSFPKVMAWNNHPFPIGEDFFAGNVVVPGTPLAQVGFAWISNQRSPVQGTMVQIPEPSTVAIAGVALISLTALRRRK